MSSPTVPRLSQQLHFLVEIDKLKLILRRNPLCNDPRRENDAEHCWHLLAMATVLAEYAPAPVHLLRVMQMLLVHDLVEIDAGDTFIYDAQGLSTQAERELKAAERIFPLLPPDQAAEYRGLWDEFEAAQTPDAQFAHALDRLQPVLANAIHSGGAWKEHHVTAEAILQRVQKIHRGAPTLGAYAEELVRKLVTEGHLT
jgi:putative hydrolase of HD superfamily